MAILGRRVDRLLHLARSASLRLCVNCSAQAFARIAARLGSASLYVMSAMFVSPDEPTLMRLSSSSDWFAGTPATRATRLATTEFQTISLMLVAASRSGSPLPESTGEPKIARSSSALRNSTLAVAA